MCPCKVCFPNDEQCVIKCSDKYVSCPLIEAEILDRNIPRQKNSSILPTLGVINGASNKNEYNIIQQPTYLPNLTETYTQRAIEIMKRNAQLNKPFFLYFAYHQTHHPQFAGKILH